MSKTLKITIIAIIVILIAGMAGFLLFYKNSEGKTGAEIVAGIFPFGKPSGETEEREREPLADDREITFEEDRRIKPPTLFQIHKAAVAGAYPFTRANGTSTAETAIRYIERGVGHIFETDLSTMNEWRVSNITRLKIYEAFWGDKGNSVIIRYLDDADEETIRSFLIRIDERSAEQMFPGEGAAAQPETEGVFLPKDIKHMAISPDGKSAFYLLDTGQVGLGTTYDLETEKTSQLFNSPLAEWLPQWVNADTIMLATKPSGGVRGYAYFLDIKTENVEKVLGGVNGLTVLASPDARNILYSESDRGGFMLNIYDVGERTSRRISLATLPEKCVWSNVNIDTIYCAVPTATLARTYPDAWYQGLVSFSDEIWMVNAETLATERIVSPMSAAREEIDAINPALGPNEKFLFFINKKDLSLWGVRL